jgi:hypothetical protein
MKYHVFNTEQEAIAAEAQIAADIGCSIIGTNAKTGLPEPDKQQTTRWAIPHQIADGRWVFPSPDGTGVDADPDWFIQNEEI